MPSSKMDRTVTKIAVSHAGIAEYSIHKAHQTYELPNA